MVLTRLLSVQQMGQIALLAVMYGFMQFLGALGLNHASPLVIPEYEKEGTLSKVKAYLNRSLVLILLSSSALAVVVWTIIPIFLTEGALPSQAFLLILVVAPFSSLETFLDSFILARYNTRNLALGRMLFDAARMVGSILLVFLGFGVTGVILGWLVAEIVAIIVFGAAATKDVPGEATSIDMRSVLAFAIPSLAFQTVDVTIQNTDRIILVQLTGLEPLGIYDVILGLLFMMSFVSLTIASSLYPIFTRIRLDVEDREGGNEKLGHVATILVRYILILLLPLGTIVAMNSEAFLRILFGAPYAEFPNAPIVLSILVLAYSLWGATYGLQTVLRSTGETRFFIYSGLGIILFEIVGCYWLTAAFGLLGGAVVRASYIIFLLSAAVLRLRQKDVRIQRGAVSSASRILLASIVSSLFVFFLNPGGLLELVLFSLAGLMVYLAILFGMKEINELDFRLAKSLLPGSMRGFLDKIESLYRK